MFHIFLSDEEQAVGLFIINFVIFIKSRSGDGTRRVGSLR
jgi:hypothetical protein